MKRWWIGCSGFHYKHWRGKFYPPDLPQTKWFDFYCEHFNTVELNVTFYRFPSLNALKGWFSKSPDDFKFTVKAPRLITHYKRFNDVATLLNKFYSTVEKGLKNKLGCVLFQLHPAMEYSAENIEKIILPMHAEFNNVIEFRHESWWRTDVIKRLREEGIAYCGISYPGLPEDVMKTSKHVYYRFHGIPNLYKSSYQKKALLSVKQKLQSFKNVDDVFIYFNNDIDVAAIRNASTFQQLTRKKD